MLTANLIELISVVNLLLSNGEFLLLMRLIRAKVKKNYDRDYTMSRGGKAYTPEEVSGPRGVVSGMLVESFFARPNRDGRGVTIYVAAKRGKPRKGEALSALQTVYGEGGSLLSKALMSSRSVQKAIADALASSFLGKGGNKLIKSIVNAVEDLVTLMV